MGEGTTRIVDGVGARVRELGDEITDVRRWLNALVIELDRRRHNVTSWKGLKVPATVAGGTLVLAALVATPILMSRARHRRQLLSRGGDLTAKARRLAHALGRLAEDPGRLAPPEPPKVPASAVLALVIAATQVLAPTLRAALGPRRF